ncbi:alpha/beta hydrolase, partial [Candidatus Saccharibacteria bacterium]|nr:alpha/beta hydrolase [Candidatus Saccharibacteria bacterium]
MTKKIATLPGGDAVAYWTHHDDKQPTLILVHGFTGSHEGFQYLVPLLKNVRLIIPDLPGFGVSPLPHNSLTLRELGECLIDFVESLQLREPPILVGHSMGSLVVSEAVRQSPSTFARKLILLSPVPAPVGIFDERLPGVLFGRLYYRSSHLLPVVGKRIAKSATITKVSTHFIMTARDKQLRRAIHGHHLDNLNFISNIGWYAKLHREINRTGIVRYKSALREFDVLTVCGKQDNVTTLRLQKHAAQKIGAHLVIIPKVG